MSNGPLNQTWPSWDPHKEAFSFGEGRDRGGREAGVSEAQEGSTLTVRADCRLPPCLGVCGARVEPAGFWPSAPSVASLLFGACFVFVLFCF